MKNKKGKNNLKMFGPPKNYEWEGRMTKLSQFNIESTDENEQSELSRMLFDFKFPDVTSIAIHDKIPGAASVKIDNDADIVYLHQSLRSVFINGRKNLMLDIYNNLTCDLWNNYCKQAVIILNKYVIVMTDKSKGISNFQVKNESYDEIKYRIDLILNYITVVQSLNILDVNYYYSHEVSAICPSCGIDLFTISEPDNSGRIICNCGYVINDPIITEDQLDVSEGAIVKPFTDILKPFTDWLNRYLGISKEKLKEEDFIEIFKLFDQICILEQWPTSEQIKSGQAPQGSLELLLKLMARSGNSSLYKIKNLVRHKYWGWPLPVLTEEQKTQIKRNYILFQTAFPKFSKRKQKINGDCNGYQLLRSVGHICYICDFKIPDNPSSVSFANQKGEEICNHIKIPFFRIGK